MGPQALLYGPGLNCLAQSALPVLPSSLATMPIVTVGAKLNEPIGGDLVQRAVAAVADLPQHRAVGIEADHRGLLGVAVARECGPAAAIVDAHIAIARRDRVAAVARAYDRGVRADERKRSGADELASGRGRTAGVAAAFAGGAVGSAVAED